MTWTDRLIGQMLSDGWKIQSVVDRIPYATGGIFSKGFLAVNGAGNQAFVKVLNVELSKSAPDPLKDLEIRLAVFNYERDLIKKCADAHLRRVVIAIQDGHIDLAGVPFDQVHYLIFELALGDVRSQTDVAQKFDTAFALRALHNVATGLMQLHQRLIAHQDLKPSNVLVFAGDEMKIADLGHARQRGQVRPGPEYKCTGDPAYAPVEQHYGFATGEWEERYLACDAYLLGSMITFFFTGLSMTTLLLKYLAPEHSWSKWSGSYADVLPHIRVAFDKVIAEITPSLPDGAKTELVKAIRELCEPDPRLRGHPRSRAIGVPYSTERYVSLFDLLATKAEFNLLSG